MFAGVRDVIRNDYALLCLYLMMSEQIESYTDVIGCGVVFSGRV